MLEKIPSESTLKELLGQSLFEVWQNLCSTIDEKYEMQQIWNAGGKNWTYEYKYRRGGKTLCSLFGKRNCVGFMIIFGKDERAKFEDIRDTLSASICRQYDEAKIYLIGANSPFDNPEFQCTEFVRNFMNLLDSKNLILDLLENEEDFNVYIGNEINGLKDFSIVTFKNKVGGKDLGTIGIIGPTRMDYSKVISVMKYINHELNKELGDGKEG